MPLAAIVSGCYAVGVRVATLLDTRPAGCLSEARQSPVLSIRASCTCSKKAPMSLGDGAAGGVVGGGGGGGEARVFGRHCFGRA